MREWLIQAVEQGRGKEPLIQSMINVFGRERFEKVWAKREAEREREEKRFP